MSLQDSSFCYLMPNQKAKLSVMFLYFISYSGKFKDQSDNVSDK